MQELFGQLFTTLTFMLHVTKKEHFLVEIS